MTSLKESSPMFFALDGCGLICKYILIVFNLFFAAVGAASFVFGLWLNSLDNTRDMLDVTSSDDNKGSIDSELFSIAVYILVILGSVILALGIFGEFSACDEKKIHLLVFCVLLSLLAVTEIIVGALAYTGRDKIGKKLGELYVDIYKFYRKNREEAVGSILTFLHSSLQCCGVTGVPMIEEIRKTCPEADTFINCPRTIESSYNSNAQLVTGFFVGTAALLIVQAICSGLLSSKIQRDCDDLQ